jgi:hypothetical protein
MSRSQGTTADAIAGAKRLAKIAEEGNRKKSEAAKGNANAAKEKTMVDHRDPPLKSEKKHVAREARAADAKVSPATMAATATATAKTKTARAATPGPFVHSQPPHRQDHASYVDTISITASGFSAR